MVKGFDHVIVFAIPLPTNDVVEFTPALDVAHGLDHHVCLDTLPYMNKM